MRSRIRVLELRFLRIRISSLILLALAGVFASSSLFAVSHAQAHGSVCITDPSATTCSASPAILSGSVGSILGAAVRVQSSESFNSFDIAIRADPSVLTPVWVDMSNIAFSRGSFIVSVRCINDRGINCGAIDGPGIVHLYVADPSSTSSGSGLLFTINYRILAASIGTVIDVQAGCQVESDVFACLNIAQALTILPENFQFAVFTTAPLTPSFAVTWHSVFVPLMAGALELGPSSTIIVRLDIVAFDGFTGPLNVAASSSPSGLTATVDQPSLFIISPDVAADVVLVSNPLPANPSIYVINVTATGGSVSHSILIPIQVVDSDFTVLLQPRSATINAGESFFPQVLLSGLNFSGNVSVAVAVSRSAQRLSVEPAFTSFSVSSGFITSGPVAVVQSSTKTPSGTYLLNVILTSGPLVHLATMVITVIDGSS